MIASDDSRTAQEESFEMWRRKRLVVRQEPRPVVVHRFADLLRERRVAAALSGAGDSLHVFGAVRPAFRLVEQFDFTDADRQRFERLGSAPVLTLRSEDQAGRLGTCCDGLTWSAHKVRC